jgi:hypothetical protein
MIKPDTPISLPASLIDDVLRYLAARPYNEVYGLITALRNTAEPQARAVVASEPVSE